MRIRRPNRHGIRNSLVIARGVLSFGLVSIPVDIHSAIEDQSIHLHWLRKKCGSRVRNQLFCPVCKVVVERDELARGFEVSKGKYVQITEEELESLEAEADPSCELVFPGWFKGKTESQN